MNRAAIIGNLLRRAALTPPDLLAADVANALHDAGGDHLVLYVVDYEQETLQPVALAGDLLDERPKGVFIEGTMAGRSFQNQEVLTAKTADGWRVWAPVRERSERIGVLELGFAMHDPDRVGPEGIGPEGIGPEGIGPEGVGPEGIDDELLALADDLGLLVGHLTHTAGRYTDLIQLRRRRRPMNLAAEMQWDMLPPLAFSSPEVAIAGLLEPAYFVAGDAFDYSLNGEVLAFAIIDAMGHGVTSTLASTLALGAFRYGRRRKLDLTVMAEHIDDAVAEQFDGDAFVTGHLARLDVATGELDWINAGHPPPLLMRGSKVVSELECAPCYPFGLGISITEIGHCRLKPGDRVLWYSDGAIEARPSAGEQFGLDRLIREVEQHIGAGVLPSETLRRVAARLRQHRGGELEDDATLVFLEWLPGR